MKNIVKVMGLPRSGTNAMNLIMNLNFNNYVCGIGPHSVDMFGWKHAKPLGKKELETLESRTGDNIKFIFMVRDFEDWQDAIFKRYSGENSTEFTTYSFGEDGFLFNTPLGAELYDSLYSFYEDRVASYKKFIDTFPEKGILINYKELKDQDVMLEKIKQHFGLIASNQEYVKVNKQVTFNNTITSNLIN